MVVPALFGSSKRRRAVQEALPPTLLSPGPGAVHPGLGSVTTLGCKDRGCCGQEPSGAALSRPSLKRASLGLHAGSESVDGGAGGAVNPWVRMGDVAGQVYTTRASVGKKEVFGEKQPVLRHLSKTPEEVNQGSSSNSAPACWVSLMNSLTSLGLSVLTYQ